MTLAILSHRYGLCQTSKYYKVRFNNFWFNLNKKSIFSHIDTPTIQVDSAKLLDKTPPALI